MKQKIYFITYGSSKYNLSRKHLIFLAQKSQFFEECMGFEEKNLSSEFRSQFKDLLSNKRGDGYWVWKYDIISQALNKVNKDDLVVYCDSGTSFNFYAKNRFYEYIEMLNDSNYSNFRICSEKQYIEKYWTSKELFNYFNIEIDSDIGNSTQFEAGHMIFKNNTQTKEYLSRFMNVLKADVELITDRYNSTSQIDGFNFVRHDQSIFSLLSKIYGCVSVKNETKFQNNLSVQNNYPFLSVRVSGHGLKDQIKFKLNKSKYFSEPVYFKNE